MKDFTFDYTLKPCPLCGSEDLGTLRIQERWYVGCLACGTHVFQDGAREAAVTAWNNLPRPAGAVDGVLFPTEKIDKAISEDERRFSLYLRLLLRGCEDVPPDKLGKRVKPFLRDAYLRGYSDAMQRLARDEDDLK